MRIRPDQKGCDLLEGVGRRRGEIGHVVLARVQAITTPDVDFDAEYVDGLRRTVEVAIEHTIETSAGAGDRPPPIPAQILAQARLAARRRIPLETMLRRYLAGNAILGDFVAEEAERRRAPPAVLRRVLRAQAAETDRVLAAISAAYRQEADSARPRSEALRRAEVVRRLLNGELVDPSSLEYGQERWHVGLVARGSGGENLVEDLAARLDGARLVVRGDDGLLWAWVGMRERTGPDQLGLALPVDLPVSPVGVGEPGRGRTGWRLTHLQARAALSVAEREAGGITNYADVAVVASAMRDDLLMTSLRSLYLEPLEEGRDGGGPLRETLTAYLAADRNITSTAAALGVNRNTVTNRLRTIEGKIGHLRPGRTGDLALALRLADLT
jgi:PucR C-terminal helix-turn-helix domain